MYALHVMDKSFTQLALIDAYESLQLERKLYEVGTMELHIHKAKNGTEYLTDGNIVFVNPLHPFLIRGRKETETKSGVSLTVTGVQLKTIADSRVTVPGTTSDTLTFGYDRYPLPTAPEAAAETVIKHYADKHMANPDDANRAYPGLVIAADQERGMLMRWSSRFESLDVVFKGIGEYSGMGYDISVDIGTSQFVFEVVPGNDRTITSLSPVVFAVQFGNVEKTEYTKDVKPLYNVGYAGGAGENEARLIQAVFPGASISTGFDRRETWLDCGNIDEYDSLIYEGKYKLASCKATETLTGDIVTSGPFEYLTSWDLGDTVTVKSVAIGLERDSQITEVIEAYEKGKRDINVTFGKRKPNIIDEIRKVEVRR